MSTKAKGVLAMSIKDKGALSAAFMPFLTNGGLFVPTNRQHNLGDRVFMLLKLLEERERLPVSGEVVWMTPAGAQGNKVAGIGVQFDEKDEGKTRSRIEDLLKELGGSQPTNTM